MKLRYPFVFQPLGDFFLAVPVGPEAVGCTDYLQLNYSSYIVMSRLVEDTTEEALVKAFLDEYDIPVELAQRDIRNIVKCLGELGFLAL